MDSDNSGKRDWRYFLKDLGKKMQTPEMVQQAIEESDDAILNLISKKLLTKDLCRLAISKNGFNIRYTPTEYLDYDICLEAMRSHGGCLDSVPDKFRSYELCYSAVCDYGDALEDVPLKWLKGKQGNELLMAAVSNDGGALFYVPEELRTYEICFAAACNSYEALAYIPRQWMAGEKGEILCRAAIEADGRAIKYVPSRLLSAELALLAVKHSDLCAKSHSWSVKWPIGMIPLRFMSKKLANISLQLFPDSITDIPQKYQTKEMWLNYIERDERNIEKVPDEMLDQQMVDVVIERNPKNVTRIPEHLRPNFHLEKAVTGIPKDELQYLPEDIRDIWATQQHFAAFRAEPVSLDIPDEIDKQAALAVNQPIVYDLSLGENPASTIYYISDIHLEHQIPLDGKSVSDIRHEIRSKLDEMFLSINSPKATLLIGGDVAYSVELEELFYEELTNRTDFSGKIISVLGNHELWDGNPSMDKAPTRPLDEIISAYQNVMPWKVKLLENSLLINFKGGREMVLSETEILHTDNKRLADICSQSTFILLGGIGFSGLDSGFNANNGIYRVNVSREEELMRSARFRAIYDKLTNCATDLPVIVLTHMPKANWSDASYNPKWIYINGHTHRNTLIRLEDGTTVLADNQIGYKPKKWYLHGFSVDTRYYDPFSAYSDGIYKITVDQYEDFNYGRGIYIQGMSWPGDLYMIKRAKTYMFLIQGATSLCLLDGGKKKKLNHDLNYYSENFSRYVDKTRALFAPYEKALSLISEEIRLMGGTGYVHGCIVDIDFYNHVYLNPIDGKITPYFATDIKYKETFRTIRSLLKNSIFPPRMRNGTLMYKKYDELSKGNKFQYLLCASSKKKSSKTISEVVTDTSIYKPSKLMLSVQYLFDKNVIRTWNDSILHYNEDKDTDGLPSNRLLEQH